MSGQNVGDLLNKAGVTWGSFMGGFANCAAVSTGTTGLTTTDYIPHHAFFQYWQSTLNANHTPRTSVAMIGQQGDAANHEYDITDFWDAVKAHNMPAVSFLKARAIQDGHAGYSNPLDEQIFLVSTINALQQTDEWKETAVIIAYDDSDGWYDHVMGPIVNQSNTSDDQLLGPGKCGTPSAKQIGGANQNGRCGYGPRLPLLVISPFARRNYADHGVTDQSSILRFIEDNWSLGRIGNGSTDATAGTLNGLFDFDDGGRTQRLILDPVTGQVVKSDGE
jgi:phospholipase C